MEIRTNGDVPNQDEIVELRARAEAATGTRPDAWASYWRSTATWQPHWTYGAAPTATPRRRRGGSPSCWPTAAT
ncbi:hypothetical protein ACFQY7_28380 [Actinomadura luteofluorescens]|uniref:hypothetical protein n=1 Tax=Actinomadura luteofluorescens TaxID=46163 RepID=UPI00362617EF